jgi:hypothetical protein
LVAADGTLRVAHAVVLDLVLSALGGRTSSFVRVPDVTLYTGYAQILGQAELTVGRTYLALSVGAVGVESSWTCSHAGVAAPEEWWSAESVADLLDTG